MISHLTLPSFYCIEVGIDETGKGSLIHNVVAGAVIMPPEYDKDDINIFQIRDSKKCSKKQLQILSDYIKDTAIAWGIGEASAKEIDDLNIERATMLAMHRALDEVYKQIAFDCILVDGNHFKPYLSNGDDADFIPHTCIVGGDNKHISIAAASIIAKVERDTKIVHLFESDPKYYPYGWNQNYGYGTSAHIEAIKTLGATEHHRMTFLKRILHNQ